MNFRDKVVSGLTWTVFSKGFEEAVRLGVLIVLARLLFPADFGLLGMAVVFIGFADLFMDLGLGSALVQRSKINDLHIHSTFWAQMTMGLLLAASFIGIAPLIAAFYARAELEPICRLLAINFILRSVGVVPQAILQKEMAFDAIAKVNAVAVLVSGTAAIAAAVYGWHVWSLVIQSLTVSCVTSVGFMWASRWYPRLIFDKSSLQELLRYGIPLVGFGFVNYWARNVDRLVIGKLLGSSALGIYTRGYTLMMLPVNYINNLLQRVMFPALSAIQEDITRVREIYLRAVGMIATVSFPMLFGLLVTADLFIHCLLGQKWTEAVPIVRILCLAGMIGGLCNPVGWIYTCLGRTDRMFVWSLGASTVLVTGILSGAAWGSLEAIAWGYGVAMLVIFYPCITFAGSLIDMTFMQVIRVSAGPFAAASVMAATVALARWMVFSAWTDWSQFIIQVLLGIITYVGLVKTFRVSAYLDLEQLIKKEVSRLITQRRLSPT